MKDEMIHVVIMLHGRAVEVSLSRTDAEDLFYQLKQELDGD